MLEANAEKRDKSTVFRVYALHKLRVALMDVQDPNRRYAKDAPNMDRTQRNKLAEKYNELAEASDRHIDAMVRRYPTLEFIKPVLDPRRDSTTITALTSSKFLQDWIAGDSHILLLKGRCRFFATYNNKCLGYFAGQ